MANGAERIIMPGIRSRIHDRKLCFTLYSLRMQSDCMCMIRPAIFDFLYILQSLVFIVIRRDAEDNRRVFGPRLRYAG